MLSAMILAHLVGDYLLQNDRLAGWKSRSLHGVFVHGAIVALVTLLLALAVDPSWWPWALGIGLAHIAIDAAKLRLGSAFHALGLFVLDQAAHAATIAIALVWSGQVAPLGTACLVALRDERLLAFAAAYVFVTMPAWVVVEFAAYGLVRGTAPDFAYASNKYVSSVERALIATLVLLGQYPLAPLVALPRLVAEGTPVLHTPRATLYVAQWLTSVALAVGAGIWLRSL